MTKCIGSPAQEMAEQYLAGSLPEQEAESFEDHYFACDLCHEYLLTLKDIRDGLAREPIDVAAATPGSNDQNTYAQDRSRGGRILKFPVGRIVLGSIAALLIVGIVLAGMQLSGHGFLLSHDGAGTTASTGPQPAPQKAAEPSPSTEGGAQAQSSDKGNPASTTPSAQSSSSQDMELAALADVRLPGYAQPLLRGEEAADDARTAFLAGMAAYTRGDCNDAVESLEKVPMTHSDGVPARLYSGVCQLQVRKLDRAEANFAAVISAGDTPQLEAAEYFTAQTDLLRGDAQGAMNWLNRTIALRGDYEEKAQIQRARMADAKRLSR